MCVIYKGIYEHDVSKIGIKAILECPLTEAQFSNALLKHIS